MRRFANQFARRQLDIIGAAKRREACADTIVQMRFGRRLGLFQSLLQDLAQLGFIECPC